MGDTVKHIKFGVGVVKNIVEGGRDYEVTVDFDKSGTKKNVCVICKTEKKWNKDLRNLQKLNRNKVTAHSVTGTGIITVHCVPSNTLRNAQIWSILLHIARAVSGFHAFSLKTPCGTVVCE